MAHPRGFAIRARAVRSSCVEDGVHSQAEEQVPPGNRETSRVAALLPLRAWLHPLRFGSLQFQIPAGETVSSDSRCCCEAPRFGFPDPAGLSIPEAPVSR